MRIVIICRSLIEDIRKMACGIGTHAVQLGTALEELGHEVYLTNEIYDAKSILEPDPELVLLEHEYSFFNQPSVSPPEPAPSLTKLLRRLNRESRLRGFQTAVIMHGYNAVFEDQNTAITSLAKRIIVPNERFRRKLIEIGARGEVDVIPLGFVKHNLPERKREETKEDKKLLIGTYGFFDWYKNFDALVEAASILKEEHEYDPTIVLCSFLKASSNPYLRYFEDLAKRLNVSMIHIGKTAILPVERVVRTLHSCDVVVLPYREMFTFSSSAALRDCISSLSPVVVPDITFFEDVPSIQEDPEHGCVYKIEDAQPETLARGIIEVINDAGVRDRLVSNSKEVIEKFSYEQIAEMYEKLFSSDSGIERISV